MKSIKYQSVSKKVNIYSPLSAAAVGVVAVAVVVVVVLVVVVVAVSVGLVVTTSCQNSS